MRCTDLLQRKMTLAGIAEIAITWVGCSPKKGDSIRNITRPAHPCAVSTSSKLKCKPESKCSVETHVQYKRSKGKKQGA